MDKYSRTKNTIRNLIYSLGSFTLTYGLSFVSRTIFIKTLNAEYLGINGLFSNILSVLSLAELGIGGAFVSMLYKPIYENDIKTIKILMNAFKKAYTFIGIFVGVSGVLLVPFLDKLIMGNKIENITLIYLLFVFGSVVSYFCAHRIAYITANQRNYIVITYRQIFTITQYFLQITLLVLTQNFILYLIAQIICTGTANLLLSRKAIHMYPFLCEDSERISGDLLIEVKRKIKAGFCLHTGHVIASGTDSLVIAKYIGIIFLGVYSNYILIIGIITNLIRLIFRAVSASVGNLIVSNSNEKSYIVFLRMQFLSFILIGFTCSCLISLINPFISLWIGKAYTLTIPITVLIVIIFYVGWDGIRNPVGIYKNASGLFYNDRWFALAEGIINVYLSVVLVQKIGIAGVFIGTIVSTQLTFWSGAVIVYKHLFCMPIWEYVKKYMLFGSMTAGTSATVYFTVQFIPHDSWPGFFLMSAMCVIMTGGIFVLLLHRTDEFKYFWNLVKKIID